MSDHHRLRQSPSRENLHEMEDATQFAKQKDKFTIQLAKRDKSIREKITQHYERAHPYNYLRHVMAFLSDRSISIFVVSFSIYTMSTNRQFGEVIIGAVTNLPIGLVVTTAVMMLAFTVWQQFATADKQKKLKKHHIDATDAITYNLELINKLKALLGDEAEKNYTDEALLEEVSKIQVKKKQAKNEETFKQNFESLRWTSRWKREVSPAARASWPALLYLELNPLKIEPFSELLLVSAGIAVGIMGFVYFICRNLNSEKKARVKEIDVLKAKRKTTEKEIARLEKRYLEKFAESNRFAAQNIADDFAKLPEITPQLIAMQNTRYKKSMALDKPPEGNLTLYFALSAITIGLSLGIGSSIISAAGRLGLTAAGKSLGGADSIVAISFISLLVFSLAAFELIKSFRDANWVNARINKIRDYESKGGDDSKPGIAQIRRESQKFDAALAENHIALAYYQLFCEKSQLMKIYGTADANVEQSMFKQLDKDYIGIKCLRKGYKGAKTAGFIIVLMAFGVLPSLYEIPLVFFGAMAVIAIMEYGVKTQNLCTKHFLVHRRKAEYADIELKQQALDAAQAHVTAQNQDKGMNNGASVGKLLVNAPDNPSIHTNSGSADRDVRRVPSMGSFLSPKGKTVEVSSSDHNPGIFPAARAPHRGSISSRP